MELDALPQQHDMDFAVTWTRISSTQPGSGMGRIFRAHGRKGDKRVDVCVCVSSFMCMPRYNRS